MWNLFSSMDFWFGTAVLGAHQIAKFREISIPELQFAARQPLIPNLQTRDFAGKLTFFLALAGFLVATFATYFILCVVSPGILEGWAKVSGAPAGVELTKFVDSVHYPLYIAAAFIGLSQPGMPFLAKIGNMQRNFFHALMGIPRRLVNRSTFFANQILARSSANKDLARELQLLVSDAWVERIDDYADTDFYRAQLDRLKLVDDADRKEALRGSRRELKNLIQQLVDAASLATVRESGIGSLDRLAADLNVDTQIEPDIAKAFLAGGILFLIGLTFLWTFIPLLDGLAHHLTTGRDLWPADLTFSGQYLVAQATPIFLASGVAVATWLTAFRRSDAANRSGAPLTPGLAAHFNRYAGVFAWVVIGVVVFDLFQAFFDYGFFKEGVAAGFLAFIPANLPFYLLHSFVSLVICFALLFYMDSREERMTWKTAPVLGLLMLAVALISLLYTAARVQFGMKDMPFGPNGVDMAVLIGLINVSAAVLAFACAAMCKRHGKAADAFAGRRVPGPGARARRTRRRCITYRGHACRACGGRWLASKLTVLTRPVTE